MCFEYVAIQTIKWLDFKVYPVLILIKVLFLLTNYTTL